MPTHHAHDASQLVYPTVIAWPEGCDTQQAAELIGGIGVVDPATARMAVAREVPFILGRFEPAPAAQLVHAVCNAGGDAFAPTMADLVTLGPTLKIRDIRLTEGNLEIDIWRGMTTIIRRQHIQFLVRGRLTNTTEDDRNKRVADRVRTNVTEATAFTRYGWAARSAAERNIQRLRDEGPETSLHVRELLDIHARNGSVFQVDGDRFAFSILGDMKQHSDKMNMDRLAELVAHISPDEVVDTYFPLFRPPPMHHLLTRFVPELRRTDDDPAFAFYSRWAALLYRHVMGPMRS